MLLQRLDDWPRKIFKEEPVAVPPTVEEKVTTSVTADPITHVKSRCLPPSEPQPFHSVFSHLDCTLLMLLGQCAYTLH